MPGKSSSGVVVGAKISGAYRKYIKYSPHPGQKLLENESIFKAFDSYGTDAVCDSAATAAARK